MRPTQLGLCTPLCLVYKTQSIVLYSIFLLFNLFILHTSGTLKCDPAVVLSIVYPSLVSDALKTPSPLLPMLWPQACLVYLQEVP